MSFYVYTLSDPRDGAVFYVGKGKGARVEAHEVEARRGKHSRKCDRIRAIWADGQQVKREIVQRFSDELLAYAAEAELVLKYGLVNLTNVVPGGLGKPRAKGDRRFTIKMLRQVAPSLRGAMHRMFSGDGRLYVGDIDITHHVRAVVTTIRADVGDEAFAEALRA